MKSIETILFILLIPTLCFCQTSLQGKVKDDTGEELIGANIVINKNGAFVIGTVTDIDGNYSVPLDPDKYDVEVSYTGLRTKKIENIEVKAGQANTLDIDLDPGRNPGIIECFLCYPCYITPLVDRDNTTTGGTTRSPKIRNLPTRKVKDMTIFFSGVSIAE